MDGPAPHEHQCSTRRSPLQHHQTTTSRARRTHGTRNSTSLLLPGRRVAAGVSGLERGRVDLRNLPFLAAAGMGYAGVSHVASDREFASERGPPRKARPGFVAPEPISWEHNGPTQSTILWQKFPILPWPAALPLSRRFSR